MTKSALRLVTGVFVIALMGAVADGEEVRFKASSLWKGEPFTLEGRLFKPEGQEPFPAVVALPGCSYDETSYRYTDRWAERLASWGYVCLVVDHLRPRGIKGLEGCKTHSS